MMKESNYEDLTTTTTTTNNSNKPSTTTTTTPTTPTTSSSSLSSPLNDIQQQQEQRSTLKEATTTTTNSTTSTTSNVTNGKSSFENYIQSDLEEDQNNQLQQLDKAEELLTIIGQFLNNADNTLEELEDKQDDNNLLGNAIVRKCHEFADVIGQLATELEDQSDDDRRQLARACIQDVTNATTATNTTSDTTDTKTSISSNNNNNSISNTSTLKNNNGMKTNGDDNNDNNSNSLKQEQQEQQEEEQQQQLENQLSLTPSPLPQSNNNEDKKPNNNDNDSSSLLQQEQQAEQNIVMSELSEDDMINALSGATTVLRDVESAFRSIESNDANEIADVGLTLARLFVACLQSLHSTITPDELVNAVTGGNSNNNNNNRSTTIQIEELSDDNDDNNDNTNNRNNSDTTNNNNKNRVRVLWPPLGPAVESVCEWGQETATKQPLLTVALGLTLWPLTIATAIFGTSVVLMDKCIQDAYSTYQNGPIVSNIEQGVSHVYNVGKLTFLCSKLIGKQTLRVVTRQINRNGGINNIASNAGQFTIDRITHPIETIEMAWNGISWSFGMVSNTIQNVLELQNNIKRQQEEQFAQNLQ